MVFPAQCSLTPEGREKLWFRRFGFGVRKTTAYNAAGAAISMVPATSVSPAIELTEALAVMAASQAAARVVFSNAPKYTSSGVR
jgi:hypothetical protein